MRIVIRSLLVAAALALNVSAAAGQQYFPSAGRWEHRSAAQVRMDSARLADAVAFARSSESRAPRDLEQAHHRSFGREPFGHAIGPFRTRGEPAGIVLRNGYIVAEWGDVERVDMTFSITKSFLSTVVGLAVDRGLIRSVHDSVWRYMAPVFPLRTQLSLDAGPNAMGGTRPFELFDTPHNRTITWDHLLRQTSDWEGTLWGKPEWADRPTGPPAEWETRARQPAGSVYEYNDVRVNVLALAALNVWRRPLPQVLREQVMDPIGASSTWRWYGYDNSWVAMDGAAVQSVSGGGHWGGGMFISARDQARFGYLTLRRGRWEGKQILSEGWIRLATTPTPVQQDYGFMNWFLNTDRKRLPSAPASAWIHLGNGTNMIYVDPEHDVVIVARWIENAAVDGLVERVLGAVVGRVR